MQLPQRLNSLLQQRALMLEEGGAAYHPFHQHLNGVIKNES
jgi:hypothetical protein